MIRFKSVLVAQDFSECSTRAMEAAIGLARDTGAALHVVYVQVLHEDPFAPAVGAKHLEGILGRLRDLVDNASEPSEGLDITTVSLRDVSAAAAIVRYAATNEIDAIVMGSHGRRGFRRLMLGSVAEEVVRTAECPVLTVHAEDRLNILRPGPNAEILLPLDFSRQSLAAIPLARQLASLTRARLRVLHVVEEVVHPAFYNASAFSVHDFSPDLEERALGHLKHAYSTKAGPVVPVIFEVVTGHAAPEIAASAQEHGCGMIVMATHGLGGMAHVFVGSVAERVVRLSHCPVLTVRAPADDKTRLPYEEMSHQLQY